MKKVTLTMVALLIVMSMPSFAESSEGKITTNYEQVMMTKGILIIKEAVDASKFEGINGEISVLTNVSTGYKTFALRLETNYYKSQYDNGTVTVIMDIDELPSAINAVQYMIDATGEIEKKKDYTEVIYRSTGDASFGIFTGEKKPQAFFEVNYKSHKFFDVDKLPKLKEFFIVARDKAISLGAEVE